MTREWIRAFLSVRGERTSCIRSETNIQGVPKQCIQILIDVIYVLILLLLLLLLSYNKYNKYRYILSITVLIVFSFLKMCIHFLAPSVY
jgi:hypothetical protein